MNNYNGNSVPKETSSEEDVEDVTSNEEQTKNAKPSLNSQQPNWFMRIYAFWVLEVYLKGLRSKVEPTDFRPSPPSEESSLLVEKLKHNWSKELEKKKPNLARATMITFGWSMLPFFVLFVIEACVFECLLPICLANVVSFFGRKNADDYLVACLSALGVMFCQLGYIVVHHPASTLAMVWATRVRIAWSTLIYQKTLRLHNSAFVSTTFGQIINLMANDVTRLDYYAMISAFTVIAPLQAIISMAICYHYIGIYCLIGLAILLLFIPFNILMGRCFLRVRNIGLVLSDIRICIMNEIIKAMRIIKMYAWEKHFSGLISEARRNEIAGIRKSIYLRALNQFISFISGRVILFAVLVAYVLDDNRLKPEVVFVTMAYINTLQNTMAWVFPNSIAFMAEVLASCKRIETFLLLKEVDNDNLPPPTHYCRVAAPGTDVLDPADFPLVSVEAMSVAWVPTQPTPNLKNINLEVKKGELLAVIGSVGSGKSTFLMSLLNEANITAGHVRIFGQIAYVSQEAWSFNASVRENILLGREYDPYRYAQVIMVCALAKDLRRLPHGDQTLVGERGVMLSGGQKARITLARALYSNADVYLLDDPLSAVDAHVANHIFEHCILDYLKDKVVILVTHQLQFVKRAHDILVLSEGRQVVYGDYHKVKSEYIDKFLSSDEKMLDAGEEEEEDEDESPPCSTAATAPRIDPRFYTQRSSLNSIQSDYRSRSGTALSILYADDYCEGDEGDSSQQQLEGEESAGGGGAGHTNRARVLVDYVRAGSGLWLLAAMIISTIVSQITLHYNDWWLASWTNREVRSSNLRHNETNIDADVDDEAISIDEHHNVLMYTALIAVQLVCLFIRSFTFFAMCSFASIKLHDKIFGCLMRAPIKFFDRNPVGRILNRFTIDLGVIDTNLPMSAYDLNLNIAMLIGSLVVVTFSKWFLVFPALVMIVLVVLIRHAYVKTAHVIKHIENKARSPMYSHTATTLSGLVTIRALNAHDIFTEQYYQYQNKHTDVFYYVFSSTRLLGVFMDLVCFAYTSSVIGFLMIFYQDIESGTLGLALSVALGIVGTCKWGVRGSAEVENQLTSVERIIEYSQIEPEPRLDSSYPFPAAPSWPSVGAIEFQNVMLTYGTNSEPTLKNLSFRIEGGQKVGVVGRTGGGKSSLISALFRMNEIGGKILIDDVDVAQIGLHELRRVMSIMPQEPVAFTGTLRKNLDPFDEYDDSEVWRALDEVQLRDTVTRMPNQLGTVICEGGANFSVGQRQLLSLARCLLRKNKILILDEATSNCDMCTDALIQKTIARNFQSCTVLTIAHRLNTIINYDKVLVLDSGRVMQFDKPAKLLEDEQGMFYQLVQQTGPSMAAQFKRSAKEADEADDHFEEIDLNT